MVVAGTTEFSGPIAGGSRCWICVFQVSGFSSDATLPTEYFGQGGLRVKWSGFAQRSQDPEVRLTEI